MKEIRSNEQIQASQESRKVEGYGVVFNSESVDLGGFTEVILPGAISEETVRNSDILFLLDHNRERGVLARSKNGAGSLKVEIDERGVRYEFEAPNTALGDEILEGLRRQDINKCSFAFTVAEDSWVKREDGTILRTISKIDRLYDISIVYNPAYEDTCVVNKRGLEQLAELEAEMREAAEEEKEEKEDEKPEAEEKSAECQTEPEEERSEEEKPENEESTENVESEEEEKEDDEPSEEERSNDSESKEQRHNLYNKENNITTTNISMDKKFSLIGTINDLIANRSNEFIKNNQIVLPFETRAEGDAPAAPAGVNPVTPNGIMQSEATMGHETIKQSMWQLLVDLKNRLILSDLGAQFLTADSEISIPKYSSGTCAWLGEVDHAVDAAGKFESEKITPKRLSAYLDISNTWLNMTGANAEEILRQELVSCIAQKIQETVFSNVAGTANRPAGMFVNVTADTKDFTFKDAVSMQEQLEKNNVYSDTVKFAASPAAKHYLRTLPIDAGSGRMVMENNEILGVECLSSNSMVEKSIVLGDWRELFIVMFSNMTIVTDTLTRAAYDQTRLIVNLSCAPYIRREEAFVKRILK